VLVTTGPLNRKCVPTVPGMNEFEGEILHSMAYKGLVEPEIRMLKRSYGHRAEPFVGK